MPEIEKLDAPFYTEAELDALYEADPVAAMRISREQHLLKLRLESERGGDAAAPMPPEAELRAALDEVRAILARDGGDVELVGVEGRTVRVRLKGACAGCPRAPLDLRNVVEALVRRRFPQVRAVLNAF
ncbi:MAG: NifU family protein [Burkholderiales bacterium]|nr:NifU family protein [Burkholderiales bacterium]